MEHSTLTGIFNRLGDIRSELKEIRIQTNDSIVLTLPEAAQVTGLSKARFYRATREKELPYYKNHGRVYFKREDVENWMLQNRVNPSDEIIANAANSLIK